jgi:hypothetical protein
MAELNQFISGAITIGFWGIGLFFYQFWRRTKDSLFGMFATTFWLLSCERILLLVVRPENELRPYVYLVRFSAFVMLIIAVILKNRHKKRPE